MKRIHSAPESPKLYSSPTIGDTALHGAMTTPSETTPGTTKADSITAHYKEMIDKDPNMQKLFVDLAELQTSKNEGHPHPGNGKKYPLSKKHVEEIAGYVPAIEQE